MRLAHLLRRDERGAGAVEFALIAPALLAFIVGIAQLGVLFMANAGLRNAVAEGARLAAIFPRPSDEDILDRVENREFGLRSDLVTEPTINHGTDANGMAFADISMSYAVPLNFIFFETPPVTLTETRRVFTQPTAAGGGSSGSTGSTGSTGGSTSAGGSTSTGGDASTSSTSTSSTSTTSTSTTSGGNGNGNGNGHGHGHGNGNGNGNANGHD